MEALREIQKKYCSRAMTAAIFAGLFLIMAGQSPLGKGLILGTVFSVVNFVLMGETLPRRMGKSKKKAFLVALGSIFLRYLFMAIPLFMAIKFEQYNLFSVIGGLFLIQVMILADQVVIWMMTTRRGQI
ncbi:ATP synthase subunit I [Thermodesulfobacteriota bacterium]